MSYISIDDDLFEGYLTQNDKDNYLDFTMILYSAMIYTILASLIFRHEIF
jgi:hypothetical protein